MPISAPIESPLDDGTGVVKDVVLAAAWLMLEAEEVVEAVEVSKGLGVGEEIEIE